MANTIKIKHGSTTPGANTLEEFELGYCSGDGLLYIGTNDGEVIRPKAFVAKRVDLTGQLQCNSYRRSVIALCETSATSASSGTYSSGTIYFHRYNGLAGSVFAFIQMEDGWNTDYGVNVTIETNACNASRTAQDGYGIRPCTFTYNGTNYGGVEVFISDAELKDVVFVGESNFDIFGLDYYDTNNDSALNSEVNDSLNYTKPTLLRSTLYVNGCRYYHTGRKPTAAEIGAFQVDGIGVSISSGENLDDYKTPGKYSVGSSTIAASLTNPPTTSTGFSMVVMDNYVDGRVIQIAVSNTNSIYERYFNGNSWSAWGRFYTTANPQAAPSREITSPSTGAFPYYGMLISSRGNTYGVSGGYDNYYIGVAHGDGMMIGEQVNGASKITWIPVLTQKLPSGTYGTTLPAAGTAGRIFFKKV